ncbi:probable cytochrome P450 49a1 [Portunus trituberculatus]|uniref:probable cytochrome P450 49a1 n=1 Tax=Portunus trituberculatus TaxID=210409 RepID=UPI001E1CCD8B|nr:probable cytochrome P450 49a1 [Portunus trituberculatus]XP_045112916.1 probable cytochrome P450 49a1 [Portunus trituberculatus]
MLRALRPVRCGLHATCLQNYITQWDKSSLKWLTKGLRTAPTEAVAQDARVNTAAGGRTNNSSRNQEVRPFASIPGPKPLPLLGNQLFFTTMGGCPVERYWESVQGIYKKYGPVVKVERFSGSLDMVMVFRPEDTRKMFQAEGVYPVRPGLGILTHYRAKRPQWFTSPGLVPGNGPEWRRLRSAIHPLLRREVINAYRPAQTEVANDLVRFIRASNEQNTKQHPSRYIIFDTLSILFNYTLEAVAVVSLGMRLGCLASTSTNHQAQSIIRANIETLTVLWESMLQLPLYKLFPTRGYRNLCAAQDTICRLVNMEVGRRREELALDPEGFTQRQPFLASLMSNPDLSSQDVFLLLVEVLQGGIDATATTLGFCLYFLAGHPSVQDQLLKEVQHVQPETHTLQGLPYLRAVVQETLRLRPSSSARSRVIQEDTIVSGYFVPAGTFIISPPNVACHDPQTFPEPDKFKPDRWLFKKRGSALNTTDALSTLSDIENKAAEEKIDPYTVVAFGHGARMCPGRRLAEQEIHLALIQLVKSYKMELAEPGKVVGQVMRLNMMPDAHLAIAFTPR